MIGAIERIEPRGDGRYLVRVGPGYEQGPGIFGGLVAGIFGAIAEREAPGWPVRGLSMELAAPTPPGRLEVRWRALREGVRTRFAVATLLDPEGRPTVSAGMVLGKARPVDVTLEPLAPILPPPGSLPGGSGGMSGAPAFTRHFEYRFAEGLPFAGRAPRGSGWIRPREAAPLDTKWGLILLDAWPLAMIFAVRGPRPMTSLAIQMQLFHPLPPSPPGVFHGVTVQTEQLREGYADQRTSLFDASGRVWGRASQIVAVLR